MKQTVLIAVLASSLISILVTIAVLTVISPQPAAAQDSAPVVTAERFVLQDAEGNIRAELRFDPFGEPVLIMRDGTGAPRARIGTRADGGAFLIFHDPDFSRRATLAVDPTGVAQLVLREPGTGIEPQDTRLRAGVFVSPDGTPSIELRDAQGNKSWSAP